MLLLYPNYLRPHKKILRLLNKKGFREGSTMRYQTLHGITDDEPDYRVVSCALRSSVTGNRQKPYVFSRHREESLREILKKYGYLERDTT